MRRKPASQSLQSPFIYQDFREAFASLKSALTQGVSYALLLGESGTGKTRCCAR